MNWKVNLLGEVIKGKIVIYNSIFENTPRNPPSSNWENIFTKSLSLNCKKGLLLVIFYIEIQNQGGNFYHQYSIRINGVIDEEAYCNMGNNVRSFTNSTIFSLKSIEDGTYIIEGIGRSINAGNTTITIRKMVAFNLI